ncbi:glycine amidinotransferase [Kitasatospora sp. NBC_01266]|uniref:glycine amidinotransferase n=1 Tax=Kitasatospora sp. NBC_01266 TaxID=2903572 RepID=UPI002E3510EA|nr:glycine amidinotransferase [Kitasatospora sp. NBC_01266]
MQLNSHDEWSPLKEIIVGSAANYTSHDRELSFDLFFHENLFRSDWAYPRLRQGHTESLGERSWRIKQQYVEELNEDVEGLARTLAGLGVTVHRPLPLPPDAAPIAGFGWSAAPVPPLNLRDNTLILGDEIVETPPAIRSRYLETRLLAPVFTRYFELGAKWTTMPRPILTDASFDLSYARDTETTLGGPTEPIADPRSSPYDVGFEMMLDGAQCLRLGRDLIVNIANANHAAACDWLERHLRGTYRVHRVHRMSDNHIDSMLLALRPGTFLARHEGIRDLLPAPFNTWKVIVPPRPSETHFPVYDDGDLILTTPYIDLNVLSVSPSEVLVNEDCVELIKTLEHEGFTVIPVRHRHRRLFGGGFHCFTLDTVRESTLEDYSA